MDKYTLAFLAVITLQFLIFIAVILEMSTTSEITKEESNCVLIYTNSYLEANDSISIKHIWYFARTNIMIEPLSPREELRKLQEIETCKLQVVETVIFTDSIQYYLPNTTWE